MVANREVEDDLLIVSDGHKSGSEVWILVLAYSHHYIPNRFWFTAYTKMDEGSVTLEDDHSCRVAGIGTV